jgi:hypothetical protein
MNRGKEFLGTVITGCQYRSVSLSSDQVPLYHHSVLDSQLRINGTSGASERFLRLDLMRRWRTTERENSRPGRKSFTFSTRSGYSQSSASRFTIKRVKTRIRLGKTWGRLLLSIEAKYH